LINTENGNVISRKILTYKEWKKYF
jgi:hypothetical protein